MQDTLPDRPFQGRQRAATIADYRFDVPKPPQRRPTIAPGSPPELLLPPSNGPLSHEPTVTLGRQTRSYSVGILDRSRGFLAPEPSEPMEALVLEEAVTPVEDERPDVSPRPDSTTDNLSSESSQDEVFMVYEEGDGSFERHPPRPIPLDLQGPNQYVEQGDNQDFPASPVLRTCLQKITEKRLSFQLDPPESPS
jgi:hypothetical protein